MKWYGPKLIITIVFSLPTASIILSSSSYRSISSLIYYGYMSQTVPISLVYKPTVKSVDIPGVIIQVYDFNFF